MNEIAREYVRHSPFTRHVGLEVESLEPDVAVLKLDFADHLVTVGDIVHGGAIGTLADVAAMAAVWTGVEPGTASTGSTVSLTVDFVAAARGTAIVATAKVVRRGRSISFCDVDVTDGDGGLVAKALVTYKLA